MGQVTSLVNALLERTTSTYDTTGNETQQVLANGTSTTTIYDAAGRTTRVAHVGIGGDAEVFAYGYDAAGRRTRVIEGTGSTGWSELTATDWSNLTTSGWSGLGVSAGEQARVTWSYDPTGQLLAEARSGANSYRTTYVYDPTGNRSVEITETNQTTSVYDGANRLLASNSFSGNTTYSYDPAGNRTRLETPALELTTYTWNAENQLTQIALPAGDVVTHVWSPINKNAEERIVEQDDGVTVTRFLWDNNNVVRETDEVGAVEAEYTYQPEPFGDLVSQRRDTDSSFYRFDALGSTTGLTDATGAVTDDYRYQAFGEPAEATGSTENPYRWVGRVGYRSEDATGLYNLRARDYDPAAGRFVSLDLLGLEAGDANFYRYVSNNASNSTDPSGNEDLTIVHATTPANAPKIVKEGLKAGEDGLRWLATLDAAGTGASKEATVHMTLKLSVENARSIPGEIIKEAEDFPNKALKGLKPDSAVRGKLFARIKWNYIAKWIFTQPEEVWITPTPGAGKAGSHYAFKPAGWAKAAPRLMQVAAEGAEAAIAAVAAEAAQAADAAKAAGAKWGDKLKLAGRIGRPILIAVAAGSSLYEIYTAENVQRQVLIETGGWAGAWAGFKGGAALGALTTAAAGQCGPQAICPEEVVTVPAGAIIVGIIGAVGGYCGGSWAVAIVYDWLFPPRFPIPTN